MTNFPHAIRLAATSNEHVLSTITGLKERTSETSDFEGIFSTTTCFESKRSNSNLSNALLKFEFERLLSKQVVVLKIPSKSLVSLVRSFSPVIVDSTCSFDVAAKRIAWGKFVNAGQV